MTKILTRFAPSPTGLLHIGNVRTALVCYLLSKSQGGEFMLRLDDTDTERSKAEYAEQIQKDLRWLGLDWDQFARQSERMDRYEEVKRELIKAGRMYPCYETQEELEIKRKMLLGRGLPPVYDRAALKLTEEEKAAFEAKGRKPHWRFKLDETATIEWDDLVKGHTKFEAKNMSDPVIIRENGAPTYMLPSTVDDIDFEISHVVRGEDHVSNTAIQIQIFEALGAKIPVFAHTSLLKSKEGKLSKRVGGFDIGALRDEGVQPMAITSLLARLGTSDPVELRENVDELVKHFDIKRFTKTAANYDVEDVRRLNTKLIHSMSFEEVKNKLPSGVDEQFWLSVRPNITSLEDVREWWNICREQLNPEIEDADFTAEASTLLPDGEWNQETWNQWIEAVKAKTGRKGKQLFMPLRKALTAREHGPELQYILPLIGREKAEARLAGKAA